MTTPFDTSDVIAALVGLGLVAKGIMDRVYANKAKDRPCAFEHKELEHKVDTILTILDERKPK